MKNLLFIIGLLSLFTPAMAQQSGGESASINTVSSASSNGAPKPAATPADLAPCQSWAWQHSSMVVTLHPDGTVSTNGKLAKALWKWVDEGNRKLEIDWGDFLDQVTIAADGQTMDVVNNAGDAYTVHLLKAEPQETGSDAAMTTVGNSASASSAEASPYGTWVWHGGTSLVTLNRDGTVNQDSKETKANWRWMDEGKRKLRISWMSGWVDDLTVAEDNKTMDVVNNGGGTFTVRRVGNEPADSSPTPTP
jgi:hypothetical protein